MRHSGIVEPEAVVHPFAYLGDGGDASRPGIEPDTLERGRSRRIIHSRKGESLRCVEPRRDEDVGHDVLDRLGCVIIDDEVVGSRCHKSPINKSERLGILAVGPTARLGRVTEVDRIAIESRIVRPIAGRRQFVKDIYSRYRDRFYGYLVNIEVCPGFELDELERHFERGRFWCRELERGGRPGC